MRNGEQDSASEPEKSRENDNGYVLERQVGFLVRRAHQRATAIFTRHFGELGLTPTQFAALAKISDRAGVSQNLLGRLTAMDPATMKGVVDRLLERGLITRRSDPSDRRRAVLDLTDSGATLLNSAVGRGFQTTKETLEPLTSSERSTLLRLLEKIG